jgi:hypothetical protein
MAINLKLTECKEVLQLTQMNSKFLACQLMVILFTLAHQDVEQQKGLYA